MAQVMVLLHWQIKVMPYIGMVDMMAYMMVHITFVNLGLCAILNKKE